MRVLLIFGLCAVSASAQLNQNCTVSVLNRNVPVNADGTWVLPNFPANFGQVKARATCVQNGLTTFGESAFFTIPANGAVNLPAITLFRWPSHKALPRSPRRAKPTNSP